MKSLKFNKIILFFVVISLSLFTTSCSDAINDPEVDPEIKLQQPPFKFKKQITVEDELGTSSIVIEIASNDEGKLVFFENGYELVPLFEKHDVEIDESIKNNTLPEINDIYLTIIEENLIADAIGYYLKDVIDVRRYLGERWINGYHTTEMDMTLDTTLESYHHNYWFLARGEFSFYYKRPDSTLGSCTASFGEYYFYW